MIQQQRRRRWMFAALGAVVVGAILWFFLRPKPAEPAPSPAVPVSASTAKAQDVPVTISALGAAQAWTSVAIVAQVSGKLLSVDFTEGSDIKAGQLLAQIDPAPYQAVLTEAQGALKRDQALLAEARLDLQRYQTLVAQNSISQQTEDVQAALVKQDEGTVEVDQGQVAAATVNVNWCRITSPISGRAGVRLVDPGNYVTAGGAAGASATSSTSTTSSTVGMGIVTINQIQPIAITFTVPEGDFQQLLDVSQGFKNPLPTKAYSQESGTLLDAGDLTIADNRVDPTTGTVELKARFPNTQEKLWSGQFVNVQLTLQTLQHATTVPVTAINRGPNGNFVFVVQKDNKASLRPVTVTTTQGAIAVVKTGVQPGDVVVTDGQMSLKDGTLVRIIQPKPAANAPQAAPAAQTPPAPNSGAKP